MTITQDSGHRGAQTPGFQNPPADSRITDLAEELQQRDPTASNHDLMADSFRTAGVNNGRPDRDGDIRMGMVVHAIPYLNWYRVQLGIASFVGCSMGAESSFIPVGVRSTSPIPPFSNVLVYVPKGSTRGFILCALPEEITEGSIANPDWLQQGGCSGIKREDAHKQPIQNLFREGGVKDFSSHRPLDGTSLEWGKMAETGVGIMIDAFQAYLRVNEACGIFFNYFDSYTRLAGVNLDVQSYARQIESREDEGENQYVEGNVIYPWEAVGCYDSGTDFTHKFDDQAVHYDLAKGAIDLGDGEENIQPIYRGVEYGGYLGQGYQRFMSKGSKDSGKRFFDDEDKDFGLWHEHIAMDGSYTMRSAKSVIIGKRVLIPVPRRKRLREDQKEGDDARKDNYKFSSKFGAGDEHKVGDVEIDGEQKHMRRVAGVLDLLAYNYNWKGLHPFHYHEEDYSLPEESELQPFSRAMDNLSFGDLAHQDFMTYPLAMKIKIDHRYNNVDYFQRESYFVMHDDGSISIGDGYGAQIVMSGGQMRLEAPGDILVLPGKRSVTLAGECIIRSKRSVDISSSEKDVRIKAEKNMQLLAGNGGRGGILLESKSTGKTQNYDNVYGEDVGSSGIVLLSKQSGVSILSGEVYIRTGGGNLKNGTITLDASKGAENIYYYGKNHEFFASHAVDIWHSPSGESASADASHRFSKSFSKLSGNVILEKNVVVTNGTLLVSKDIVGGKNVIATAKLAHSGSIFVGDHKGKVDIQPQIQQATAESTNHVTIGGTIFDSNLKGRWYTAKAVGSEDLLQQLGFSFRDPPGSPTQYKTTDFKLPETRWQQYARTGMGSGGTGWTEKPVLYQGTQTYPWPGKQKWVDEPCQLQYAQHSLFDTGQGHSQDRPGPYETPKLGDWTPQVLDGTFKTIY